MSSGGREMLDPSDTGAAMQSTRHNTIKPLLLEDTLLRSLYLIASARD